MWIPSPHLIDQSSGELQLAEVPEMLLQRFSLAFGSMPNLRTFVSIPWPADFVWAKSDYKFTTNAVPIMRPKFGNLGLALVLKQISAGAFSKLQNLYWADIHWRSSCGYLGQDTVKAFRTLTSLDLCLSSFEDDRDIPNICSALRAAAKLEHLKLCFEQHLYESGFLGCLSRHEAGDKGRQPVWSRLSSLSLVEASFHMDEMLEFLDNHAHSIHHLHLDKCQCCRADSPAGADTGNWKALMNAIASLKRMNLHSIEILQDEDITDEDPVLEGTLLQFINGCGPSPFHADLSYNYISTRDLDVEDKDFCLPEEFSWWNHEQELQELEDCVLVAECYWTLRRVRNYVVWWDVDHPCEGHYKTERWLFEHKNGSYAYVKDPWEYFEDWESYGPCECGDDGGSDGDSEWHDDPDEPAEVMIRAENIARESPFGPTFDAFGEKEEWEPVEPRDLEFPSHAMILLDHGLVIPWLRFKDSYVRSWQLVMDLPVRMRAE